MSLDWLGDLWNGVLDLFGVGTSAAQTKMNYDINQKNYNLALQNYDLQKNNLQFQKDSYLNNFNYQKMIQNQIFGREDNAIQRRVADLEKAGLSKTLAAGDGAGAGSVVSTSPFTGSANFSAPVQSPVDLISTALQFSQAKAQIDKTNAETENLIKEGKVKDSQVIFTDAQTAYVKAQTAVATKNYDMMDLTAEQIKATNEKTQKEIEKLESEIASIDLNTDMKNWEFLNLYPEELKIKIEQYMNLQREGRYTTAKTVWQEIQSDIATQNLFEAEYTAKIKALDYEYQSATGVKPGESKNWVVQVISALFGDTEWGNKLIEEIVPGWQSGKPEHSEATKGSPGWGVHDNTPR